MPQAAPAMPRFPWKAGLGPVPAVVLGHGAAWRVRTSGFVCSWSAALVLCSQFGVKTALNSQNMRRLLLRCFPCISGIVFSGSIAGEGQKSTRLQGWEDGGGLSPPFQHPHARSLLCHGYPGCKAEITPLAHAGKHWQGWKRAGPGGKMSPKGIMVPAVIDGALIGGGDVPWRGAQRNSGAHRWQKRSDRRRSRHSESPREVLKKFIYK